jgi:Zn-dependent peptidase ImmA (M78 family)
VFLPLLATVLFENWNRTVITEDDLYQFCEQNKVWVLFDANQKFGRYLRYKGHDFILINPKLSKIWRWWVLAHEVAHFALHEPHNFNYQTTRKADYEANFIAAPMLLPRTVFESKCFPELLNEDEYPLELLIIRKSMSEIHKL